MTRRSPPHKQRGLMLLAVFVLLMVAAAAVMVNRANRISNADSADIAARMYLSDWMVELKYALVMKAIGEDNTPGTMPCPGGTPSCSATDTDLVGTPPSLTNLLLPNGQPQSVCIQYVLAPSLRNSLDTDLRGGDPAQKQINPDFNPDLTFIDNTGKASKVWAVLLGSVSGNSSCTIGGLGYQHSVNAFGISTLNAISSASASTMTVQLLKKDFEALLFAQILNSTDSGSLGSYISGLNFPSLTKLSLARAANPGTFDSKLLTAGATLVSGSLCPKSITPSSTPKSTSKKPVSWLCFNAWYDYIQFDPNTSSFQLSNAEKNLTCTRKIGGATSCTN